MNFDVLIKLFVKSTPDLITEKYWEMLVEKQEIEKLSFLIKSIKRISENGEKLQEEDSKWILARIVDHIVCYVADQGLEGQLDEMIYQIIHNCLCLGYKTIAFRVYNEQIYKTKRESLIEDILTYDMVEYVIEETFSMIDWKIDEYNADKVIQLLVDFRHMKKDVFSKYEKYYVESLEKIIL